MEIGSSYEVQGVAPGRERTLFSAHKKRPVFGQCRGKPKNAHLGRWRWRLQEFPVDVMTRRHDFLERTVF